MNTFRRSEVVTTRMEYAMPSGTMIGEINKLENVAWTEFCRLSRRDPNSPRTDDWCQVKVDDDEIVFFFEVDKRKQPDV